MARSGHQGAARHTSTGRGYRRGCRPLEGECCFQVVVEESDLWITARSDDADALRDAAAREISRQRARLKSYIGLHPDFGGSLVPVPVSDQAPEIIRDMAAAGAACGVGPMAAVAGAIAERTAAALAPLLGEPPADVLAENGGDLFMHSSRERLVGLLPDPGAGVVLGLTLPPGSFPLALCSSSGRIGHSLSLGVGDLVTVRSRSGAFADAAATALCNLLQGRQNLQEVLDKAREWSELSPGLDGVFAQCGGQMALWGDMELAAV